MHIETLAVLSGGETDPETGAITPPIHLSTTFEHGPAGERHAGYEYIREANPTQQRLEAMLAALEGGAAALAFASGQAAMNAVLMAMPAGAEVVVPEQCYTGLRLLCTDFLVEKGVVARFVDTTDIAAVADALGPATRLVWLETPSNPELRIADIAATAELAHARGALLACDNTFATPLLQRPLALGADIVVHSTTKYFGGHSDVLGGAVVFARRDALHENAFHRRHIAGAALSPFNAWLTLRGARSLSARMALHCRNARAVADFLAADARIERVNYPGLVSHPGHAIAARQMRDFGGMLSFCVRGGREAALAVAARVDLVRNATSLGGCESLLEHRASVEGPQPLSPPGLLRLSVGLEHADDLIADLDRALG